MKAIGVKGGNTSSGEMKVVRLESARMLVPLAFHNTRQGRDASLQPLRARGIRHMIFVCRAQEHWVCSAKLTLRICIFLLHICICGMARISLLLHEPVVRIVRVRVSCHVSAIVIWLRPSLCSHVHARHVGAQEESSLRCQRHVSFNSMFLMLLLVLFQWIIT